MKTPALLTLAAVLALALVARAASDKPAASPHTLGEWKLGAHIAGPEVTLDDAKGKAVLIDYWGIHCGPCLASLPDIEKIARRNKTKMIVIGAHSQTATEDEVKEVVKKNRLSYTITKGAPGPIKVSGIPRVMVFDTEGRLVFEGHPGDREFDHAVRTAVRGAAGSSTVRPSGLDALKKPGTASTR